MAHRDYTRLASMIESQQIKHKIVTDLQSGLKEERIQTLPVVPTLSDKRKAKSPLPQHKSNTVSPALAL